MDSAAPNLSEVGALILGW
ncbi:hypothetical protein [Kribbella sp. NPDC000426]